VLPIFQAAPTLKAWRRDLHAHPETAFEEVRTSAFIAEKLASFGVTVHRGIGVTGVVGVIEGLADGPSIGLRADMDALPMIEETGAPYSSTFPGKFHGCGHDGHTVMLLGAAQYLAANRPARGRVHLIFQPAEEVILGAPRMIEEGLFERFPCSEIYALHTMPLLPEGTAAVRAGATLSAGATFTITVDGVGGHGAAPHTTIDPLQVAARIAVEISSIVGRYVDPAEAAIITVGQLSAGSAANIIPATATLSGTIRTFSKETQTLVIDRLKLLCSGFQATFGCSISCEVEVGCPPCINAPQAVATVAAAAADVIGADKVDLDSKPLPFSDDFGFMLDKCPGAYLFLGQNGEMCHHPKFDFDDELLPVGASILCRIVERKLGSAA
jgi:amidohydrolase